MENKSILEETPVSEWRPYNEEDVNEIINLHKDFKHFKTELISDGYHTFKELYDIRLAYNVALFNEWSIPVTCHTPTEDVILERPKYNVHKSWKHFDGELCFGGGWFIVVAVLPTGQISNHYEAKYWDLFKIPEVDKALFEFDGHNTEDCINRLKSL